MRGSTVNLSAGFSEPVQYWIHRRVFVAVCTKITVWGKSTGAPGKVLIQYPCVVASHL